MRWVARIVLALSLLVVVTRVARVVDIVSQGTNGERISVILLFTIVAAAIVWGFPRNGFRTTAATFFDDIEVKWGTACVATMLLLAIYAPIITPHDPQFALYGRLRDWSSSHLFGTDASGRDALSRMLFGARTSLTVALSSTAIAVIAGITVGMLAALSGRPLDGTIMRFVDAGIAFPRIFLLLALLTLSPTVSMPILVVILGLTSWFDIARLVRAEVLAIRQVEFMVASTGLGFGTPRKMLQHILPNVAGPIIVSATLTMGYLILIESGLSYIGVGLQAGTPSWGTLINEGYPQLRNDPHLTLVPGALIAITVIGFSLIGDGVRRSLDPRHA